jgi:hypothetical protein
MRTPVLRAQADSLYLPFLEDLSPSIEFDAAFEPVGEEANHG